MDRWGGVKEKYKVTIFDDRWSILHFLFGVACGVLGLVFGWIIYAIYEVIDYVRKRDTIAGDYFEFLAGYATGAMIADAFPPHP